MAQIVIPDHLLHHFGNQREFDLPVANYRELTEQLNERFPGTDEVLRKTAVAIDGQIYQDAWLEPIGADSEVFLMQRIEGG